MKSLCLAPSLAVLSDPSVKHGTYSVFTPYTEYFNMCFNKFTTCICDVSIQQHSLKEHQAP